MGGSLVFLYSPKSIYLLSSGSSNSQSSSSSSGFSTSSETTADGRVSRTTVYGGTPYTITQSSQSSPNAAQGGTVSSIQIGQNPPQIFQDSFPRVSMPFQTSQFGNRPMQSLGMPMLPLPLPIPPLAQAATVPQASPIAPPNPSSTAASPNIGQPQGVNSSPRLAKAVVSDANVADVANQAPQLPNQLPDTANRPSNPIPPVSSNPASTPASTNAAQGLNPPPRPTKAVTNQLLETSTQPSPPPTASPNPPAMPPSANAAQGLNSPSPTVSPNSPTTPPSANAAQGLNPPARPTKAVTSDPNTTETANQAPRPPTQLPETLKPPQTAEKTGPAPSDPAGAGAAQTPTPKANATNASPVRNFPVLGLPVGPHPQELVSTKPTTENFTPERTAAPQQNTTSQAQPVNNNPASQMQTQTPAQLFAQVPPQVLAQTTAQTPPQTPARTPAQTPPQTPPRTQAQIPAQAQPQTPAQAQAQTPAQAQRQPNNPPPTAAPVPATGTAAGNDSRLETGVIPVIIESFTADGLPFRSEGLVKISNIVPLA
ncbi:uncharacterized protein PGTG_08632 [Puccinia graminis f. sp. tritici CRL 75-36-700-3]|uniref:Uncharacterized protein n=1 Tax=Puccinia graminis f. sp. tritici (strain CRL 75-36-700-3 / race SCCL) TaxID=418459 RepID=E3KGM1_PUCGT|nr:uncharacterized protein PGTG_08632 [Puccinia graminis f. sp. tritici CRL 75-36-700-3]EFP83446.2 hypothetical protein PGTG_08632 [Puccinia graminis f. sp. tritici CRL 75-36-700-3]